MHAMDSVKHSGESRFSENDGHPTVTLASVPKRFPENVFLFVVWGSLKIGARTEKLARNRIFAALVKRQPMVK